MKRISWSVVFVSLTSVSGLLLYSSSPRVDGNTLTFTDMESTCGGDVGGCVLSGPLTDCNQSEGGCNSCLDSQSRETLEGQVPFNYKVYLGADRRICTTPTTSNKKVCDPGTVTCWIERTCTPGGIVTDKSCNANHATGDCEDPDPETTATWYCMKFHSAPTGFQKTKNDDDCIDPPEVEIAIE